MDQELLVDDRFEDGEKLLAHLVRSGFDVTVAFWVLTSEDSSWYLYIGSNTVVSQGAGQAFGMLYVCLSKIPNISISWSDVKLVPPSNPIAANALALRDRNKARLPARYRGKRLGDLAIEEAYIYPKTGPMTRDEIMQTVMEHLKRGSRAQPASFTFADGSVREAIPIGMHYYVAGQGRGLQFDLQDPGTGQSQAVAADDVVNIQ